MNNMIGSCPAKQFQFVQSHACLHSKTLFIIKFYWFKLVPIVADSMYIYKPMSSMWRRQQTCIWCHMSIYISMWVPDHNWLGFFFFCQIHTFGESIRPMCLIFGNRFSMQLSRFNAWGSQWQYYKIIRWPKTSNARLQWIARCTHAHTMNMYAIPFGENCIQHYELQMVNINLSKYLNTSYLDFVWIIGCINRILSLEIRVLRWPFSRILQIVSK